MKLELETALAKGSVEQVEQMLPLLLPGLISFVRVRFNAGLHDAEDAASGAVLQVMEKLREGHYFDVDRLTAYLRVSARRLYYRSANRQTIFDKKEEITDDDLSEELVSDHLETLIETERMLALKSCINSLAEDARDFIEHMLRNAADNAERLAAHFSTSVNNIWTKKSRILKQVHECVKKKV